MSFNIRDWVYQVNRQFPTGTTTYSTCYVCNVRPSRGGSACLDCLTAEHPDPVKAKVFIDARKASHAAEIALYETTDR